LTIALCAVSIHQYQAALTLKNGACCTTVQYKPVLLKRHHIIFKFLLSAKNVKFVAHVYSPHVMN